MRWQLTSVIYMHVRSSIGHCPPYDHNSVFFYKKKKYDPTMAVISWGRFQTRLWLHLARWSIMVVFRAKSWRQCGQGQRHWRCFSLKWRIKDSRLIGFSRQPIQQHLCCEPGFPAIPWLSRRWTPKSFPFTGTLQGRPVETQPHISTRSCNACSIKFKSSYSGG